MSEVSRMILALRTAGWEDKAITDFILWVGTGDEKYRPSAEWQMKKKNDYCRTTV